MPCTPKMKGCKTSCLHYLFVKDYREERERQETYAEEHPEPVTAHDLITFHTWLGKGPRNAQDTGSARFSSRSAAGDNPGDGSPDSSSAW